MQKYFLKKWVVIFSFFLFCCFGSVFAQEKAESLVQEELSEEDLEVIENLDFLDSLDFLESEEELAFLDDYQDINDFEE